MSKPTYISAVIFGVLGTVLLWGFAAGWAGQIRFFPDTDGLSGGDWMGWTAFTLFYWTPPILALWGTWKLLTGRSAERGE